MVSKGIQKAARKRLFFGAWMGARFCRRRSGENPEAELIAQRKAGVKQGAPREQPSILSGPVVRARAASRGSQG